MTKIASPQSVIKTNQTVQISPLTRAFHRAFNLGALKPHVKTILPHLDSPGGTFVEVGARDGLKDSITPYLEKGLGWQGLLIEPWPHLYHQCRKNRKSSITLNVAASESLLRDSYIEIYGRPPSASVRLKLIQEAKERLEGKAPVTSPPVSRDLKAINYVSTNSITGILDRANFETQFDLMAFNLIGYENQALDGLDFDRYQPTFLLFRTITKNISLPNLPPYYQRIVSSSHNDRTNLHLFRYSEFGAN